VVKTLEQILAEKGKQKAPMPSPKIAPETIASHPIAAHSTSLHQPASPQLQVSSRPPILSHTVHSPEHQPPPITQRGEGKEASPVVDIHERGAVLPESMSASVASGVADVGKETPQPTAAQQTSRCVVHVLLCFCRFSHSMWLRCRYGRPDLVDDHVIRPCTHCIPDYTFMLFALPLHAVL
jgi:hypothetical protein